MFNQSRDVSKVGLDKDKTGGCRSLEASTNVWILGMSHVLRARDSRNGHCRTIPSTGETLLARDRGVSHRQHSIILCIFAYKFISNLLYLNEIASSSPPLYIMVYHKIHILHSIVLQYPLLPSSRALRTSIDMNTIYKCPV